MATELSTCVDRLETGFGEINANLLEADFWEVSEISFPPEVLAKNFRLLPESVAKLPTDSLYIFRGNRPESLEAEIAKVKRSCECTHRHEAVSHFAKVGCPHESIPVDSTQNPHRMPGTE